MIYDYITPELIDQYPDMNSAARNNISAIRKSPWVRDYFCWLNKVLACLKRVEREKMVSRMIAKGEGSYHEVVAEIVFLDLWNWLRWRFTKDPTKSNKTPDFEVHYGAHHKSSFVCEVSVIRHDHPHAFTMIDEKGVIRVNGEIVKELPVITDPIDQVHRIIMKIDQKQKKYSAVLENTPIVVGLFQYGFENQFYMDEFQFKNALYGDLKCNFVSNEISHQPSVHTSESNQEIKRGLFGFEEYSHIAAVIVCCEDFYKFNIPQTKYSTSQEWWKLRYGFTIYSNPQSAWAQQKLNPFAKGNIPVSGILKGDRLLFSEPYEIEFY
jgi:hypothetical protein